MQALRSGVFLAYGLMNFTRQAFLNNAKNFKESDVAVDMAGKNCLVTGGNSGIGLATAKALAARGATVCLVCRSRERGEQALSDLKASAGNNNVHLEICDLSSLEDVKTFAIRYASTGQPLHVLVNNAGTGGNQSRELTKEGLEVNFAVNVGAVFTLTEALIPALERAAPEGRVVTVASGGMYTQPLNDDLQFMSGKFDGIIAYARNKRLQVALAEKWTELYGTKGIGFYSMHPGWADTGLVQKQMPQFRSRLENRLRTQEQGADTVVWLALQPNSKLEPGGFYFDRKLAQKHLPACGTTYSAAQLNAIYNLLANGSYYPQKEPTF
eukprot:TRINITY_DN2158_c0_g1_i1.p1 TRINITY_DN2158_c0_g1~~TRINITY_DN2158_c0_g1_i1.p1  ORF type:complete len:326 (-),score=53.29 TRINITY_DN2158_c0_g1_i1:232-1209(-)